MKSASARMFWGTTAVAFLIRAVHVLLMSDPLRNPLFAHPIMDSAVHDGWARELLAGTWPGPEPFFRAPLYPFFLGGLYAVIGAEQRLWIQLVHALISAAGAGLAALCAARIWGGRTGWLAGLIMCGLWTSIYFCSELVIVTLATTLNLLLLWLLLPAADQSQRPLTGRRIFLIGAVWGLSAIARPNVLILGPVIIWSLWRHRKPHLRAAHWAVLMAGLLLPILPVTAHNVLRGHDAVLIASQGGVNFYIGNNAESDGRTAVVPGTRATWQGGYEDAIALAEKRAGRPLKPSAVDRYYLREGLDFLLTEPVAALRLYGLKLSLLLGARERSNNKNIYFWSQRSPLLRWPLWWGFAPVLALAVLGFWRRDITRAQRWVVLGAIVAYAFSILLFFINARFRLPVMAYLVIPAGAGLDLLLGGRKARQGVDLRFGLALAGLLLVVAVLPDHFRFHEHRREADPYSWHTLGNGYLAAGNHALAERAYRQALASNRRYPQPQFAWIAESVYTRLGDLLVSQERSGEALGLYEQWVRDDPCSSTAHIRLGDLHLEGGRIDAAAAHFEVVLRQEPGNPAAQLGYAWVLLYRGSAAAALRRFQEVQQQTPQTRALFGAGLSLIELQRWDEAEQVFKDILAAEPAYWQAWGNLAGLYERTGHEALARQAYERLLRLRPQDARARQWLAEHPR